MCTCFRNLYEIEDSKLLCLAKTALSTLDRKPVIKLLYYQMYEYCVLNWFNLFINFIFIFSVEPVVLEH